MSRKYKGAHFADPNAKKTEVKESQGVTSEEDVAQLDDAEASIEQEIDAILSMDIEEAAADAADSDDEEAGLAKTVPVVPMIPDVDEDATPVVESTSAMDLPESSEEVETPGAEEDASDEVSETELFPSVPTITATPSSGPKHGAAVEPKKRSRIPLIVTLLLVGLLAGGYVAGLVAFSRYFMPNTTLDGEDVSLREVSQVAEEHGAAAGDYSLSITGENFSLDVKASQIGLRSDGDAYVNEALSQVNPWIWPAQILTPHNLTAHESITFEQSALDKLVEDAVKQQNEAATMPVNASAAYDKESQRYVVTPEVPGTALDTAAVNEQVSEALLALSPSVELGEDALIQPTVFQDDEQLLASVDEINKRLGAVQKLTVGDKDAFEVTSDQIASWLQVADDLSVTVNTSAITEWARGELSDKLDSVGKTRDFTRPDGKKVRVTGGDYGWSIDGAELANQIAANIEEGTEATIDIPMLQTGEVWNPGGQDWGNRYIDIDISEQYVRMYDGSGSLVWESECVTGNVSEKHDTPQGVYQLNSNKEKGNITLEGPIDEKTGQPEYVSYVTYWMPFIWNSIAMHDATWRYSFGGTVYQYNGSHGCVNLPYEKAEQLFYLCEVGDVVVVHP